MEYLDLTVYENPVRNLLLAGLLISITFAILMLVRAVLIRSVARLVRRTSTHLDNAILAALQSTRGWILFLIAVSIGVQTLVLPPQVAALARHLLVLGILLQLSIWVGHAIRTYVQEYAAARADQDGSSITTVRAIAFVLNLVIWVVFLLMALDNVGINITALVAGLGIGGIAIALAVQNILSDLFSSLSIVLDKPFVHGDFIVIDEMSGTVEHIGIKTTRLRSLSGEQIVFANTDLLESRIRNYKRMYERRIGFSVHVPYRTPREKLALIPNIIQEAIESLEGTRFDRSHFHAFGEYALEFETVYFVLDPSYNLYMDLQESINLRIHEVFEEHGIEFALPTQTVVLHGSQNPEP